MLLITAGTPRAIAIDVTQELLSGLNLPQYHIGYGAELTFGCYYLVPFMTPCTVPGYFGY